MINTMTLNANIFHVLNSNIYYYIHENGFIINLDTGYIISSKNQKNYINIKNYKYKLDKLIYCNFHKLQYRQKMNLIHLDGNMHNNNINNLKLMKNTILYNRECKKIKAVYNKIEHIILYKKYDKNFNLLQVYTNFKFVKEISMKYRKQFLITLLNENITTYENNIWEINIIKLDVTNTVNYIPIENSLYKISKDNTHIIDNYNRIYHYKVDHYNRQYFNYFDNNDIKKTIYYKHIDELYNYYTEFANDMDNIDLDLDFNTIFDHKDIKI
jgi:hypothetical protein